MHVYQVQTAFKAKDARGFDCAVHTYTIAIESQSLMYALCLLQDLFVSGSRGHVKYS